MDRRTITPLPGHVVTDERGQRVTKAREVLWGMHWARLERHGAVRVSPAKTEEPKTKAAKKAEG
jgi:hypothetical protein